jgi:glycosyltransferase involved in cell wall biosynthesis
MQQTNIRETVDGGEEEAMMKSNLFVSIIINNYNYGKFLSEAIDSALNQTYSYHEVIVVDDGSTDNSREIIEGYKDKIVPVLKENGGQASAFNTGFAASKGDIICFLDSDDSFLPEKIEKIIKIFENYKDVNWCFHLLSLMDIKSKKILKNSYESPSSEWDFRSQVRKGRLPYIPFATSSLCFRRTILQEILPMPEAIKITSDNYLKFTAFALSEGFFLNEELTIQNIHENNAYTLSDNKHYLQAKILILTAYWIKAKFPSLSKFSDNLLVDGVGIYLCIRKFEPGSKKIVKEYLSSVDLFSKLNIISKAFYYCLKNYTKIRSRASV